MDGIIAESPEMARKVRRAITRLFAERAETSSDPEIGMWVSIYRQKEICAGDVTAG